MIAPLANPQFRADPASWLGGEYSDFLKKISVPKTCRLARVWRGEQGPAGWRAAWPTAWMFSLFGLFGRQKRQKEARVSGAQPVDSLILAMLVCLAFSNDFAPLLAGLESGALLLAAHGSWSHWSAAALDPLRFASALSLVFHSCSATAPSPSRQPTSRLAFCLLLVLLLLLFLLCPIVRC
jgi:hypothetical protein